MAENTRGESDRFRAKGRKRRADDRSWRTSLASGGAGRSTDTSDSLLRDAQLVDVTRN